MENEKDLLCDNNLNPFVEAGWFPSIFNVFFLPKLAQNLSTSFNQKNRLESIALVATAINTICLLSSKLKYYIQIANYIAPIIPLVTSTIMLSYHTIKELTTMCSLYQISNDIEKKGVKHTFRGENATELEKKQCFHPSFLNEMQSQLKQGIEPSELKKFATANIRKTQKLLVLGLLNIALTAATVFTPIGYFGLAAYTGLFIGSCITYYLRYYYLPNTYLNATPCCRPNNPAVPV